MQLPIPFTHQGKVLTDVEMGRPTGSAIANCQRLASNGEEFAAVAAFTAGSVASFSGPSGDVSGEEIKAACRSLPWPLAEWLMVKGLVSAGVDPRVDVLFKCPRCKKEFTREDPVDVSALDFVERSEVEPTVTVDLGNPVEFKDAKTGTVVESVSSIKLSLGTISQCIKAAARAGGNDVRLQYAVWADSIVESNGTPVNDTWRGSYGSMLFEKMDLADLRKVSSSFSRYAIDSKVDAVCPHCGKEFRQEVPTSSFFDSGLQGVSV